MKPFDIAEPCSESWNTMRIEASGRARHCASCDKHVVDLSRTTPAQIRGLQVINPEGFCGRQEIRGGALVVLPEPVAQRARWPMRVGLGGALIAGTLATAACQTASAAGPEPTPVVTTNPDYPAPPLQESNPAPELIETLPPQLPQIVMGRMAYTPPPFSSGAVAFSAGSAKLSKAQLAVLDDIAVALKANAWIPAVAISAHVTTDEVAPARLAKLSQARAKAVRDALAKRGVAAARLRIAPFDAAKTDTADGRRVDVQACELGETCP